MFLEFVECVGLWLSFDTWSHMEATQSDAIKYFLQAADVNFRD